MNLDWQSRWLEHTEFGGVGISVALGLVLVLRVLLPKAERGLVRGPLVLALLHAALVTLRVLLPAAHTLHRPLQLTALFCLLASLGRGFFVLGMHTVLMRRLSGPVPRILQDVLQVLIYTGAALITLQAAGVEPGSLLTTSALLTAVLGLSLQDTLGNLFAGLAIQAQRPFQVNDWVQFERDDRNVGRVVEVNWRATSIMTNDQVEVIIPNAALAKAPIVNFSRPRKVVRRQVSVFAPYHYPTGQIHDLLLQAAKDVPGVLAQPPVDVLTNGFDDRGVEYSLRYFIDRFDAREPIASAVRDRLWYALERANIGMPFPRLGLQLEDLSAAAAAKTEAERAQGRWLVLRKVELLAALPDDALQDLAARTRSLPYTKGEIILRQGDPGQELFVVEQGEVRVVLHVAPSQEREVARLGAGSFFGEMSLLTGEERSATVVAATEVLVLVVDKTALRPILETHPEVATTFSKLLAIRQAQLAEAGDERRSHADTEVDRASNVLLHKIRGFFSL